MKSKASRRFWQGYRELPPEIQTLSVKQYRLWRQDPRHPSLHFKKVGTYWSCRVTDAYRALAVVEGDTALWFWIGTHREYERLIHRRP